jgi:hypothetical protein
MQLYDQGGEEGLKAAYLGFTTLRIQLCSLEPQRKLRYPWTEAGCSQGCISLDREGQVTSLKLTGWPLSTVLLSFHENRAVTHFKVSMDGCMMSVAGALCRPI